MYKRQLLHKADDDTLTIKEYINGLSGSEYYAKVTANRFKTTIRYGRRETVNPVSYTHLFYYDYSEFTPGPVVQTEDELLNSIKNIDTQFDKQKVIDFKEKFMGSCDRCV